MRALVQKLADMRGFPFVDFEQVNLVLCRIYSLVSWKHISLILVPIMYNASFKMCVGLVTFRNVCNCMARVSLYLEARNLSIDVDQIARKYFVISLRQIRQSP